jgi:hypothetical protein
LRAIHSNGSQGLSSLFPRTIRDNQHVFWLAILGCTLSIGWFFLDGNVGINLADEGHLWYGTQAVRLGQIPIRDFLSYDPGRYLWTAAWSFWVGDGLVSLRFACVLFQCLGVLAGLLAARRLSRNWLFLTGIALLLCVWMHPRYKVFEQSIALMAIYAGVLLLERPSLRRHWWVGVFGGVAAFMGCNHGAYHVLAFGLLIAWSALGGGWNIWLQRCLAWGAGLLVGYLPQWLMFVFVSGYFPKYVANIKVLLSNGTNVAKSVPWPWVTHVTHSSWGPLSAIMEGCYYLLFPAFFALIAIRAWQLGRARMLAHPVLVASIFVTLPYMHYVFSRPDIVHLSHGAPAVAIGFIALGFSFDGKGWKLGYLSASVLIGTSFLANLFQFGVTSQVIGPPNSLFPVVVKGQQMLVRLYFAKALASADHLAHDLAKPDEPIFFMPLPGLYPFTGRLSPTKRNYFTYPSPEEDRNLLAEIEAAGVEWVMIQDYAIDGRDDLRFRNANPLVFDYFVQNFTPVPIATLPGDMVVLRRSRSRPGR